MVDPRGLRIPIKIDAVVIKGDLRCEGVVKNLSEDGLMVTVFREQDIDLSRGKTIDIEFVTATGKTVNVHCQIMRSERPDPKGIEYHLGVKIMDMTSEYEEFFRSLYIKEMGMF